MYIKGHYFGNDFFLLKFNWLKINTLQIILHKYLYNSKQTFIFASYN